MKINLDSILFTPEQIANIEKRFNAKYVCETCLKNKMGNWINQPCALFWTDVPHPQGSNYFALYFGGMGDVLMIANGISATQEEFTGIIAADGNIYYSRYRHDYRNIPGGFIDGGRDYIRLGGDVCKNEKVSLKIVGPELVLIRNSECTEIKSPSETKLLEHHSTGV
jgi:hypothetical protein